MKILLLGKNGQVGRALAPLLAPLGELVCWGREQADLDRPETLAPKVKAFAPDLLINAAAYTAVDQAESDTDAAQRANALAPGELAQAAAGCGALLIHYSTDYVFDGTLERPYREEDPTRPLNQYGLSKLGGEKAVLESGAAALVLRTSWVYDDQGKNFLNTMKRLMAEREELKVVNDQQGSPTWAGWIAQTTVELAQVALKQRQQGQFTSQVLHLTGRGATTWFGFAEEIRRHLAEQGKPLALKQLLPIPASEYPTPAKRPANSRLDISRLEAYLGRPMPSWQAMLGCCLAAD